MLLQSFLKRVLRGFCIATLTKVIPYKFVNI